MKRALILLLLLAAPVKAQLIEDVRVLTVGQLPGTCTVARIYNVIDGSTATDCATGGGANAVWCECDTGGTTYTGIDPSAAGGTTELFDDKSPQLGGQLDVNGFSLGDGTLELLSFVETPSAVNELTITNAATGSGPTISATGGDSDVDLTVRSRGLGNVDLFAGDVLALQLIHVPVSVNYFEMEPQATGQDPRLSVKGTDDNIDFRIESKGTGAIIVGAPGAASVIFESTADSNTEIRFQGNDVLRFQVGGVPGMDIVETSGSLITTTIWGDSPGPTEALVIVGSGGTDVNWLTVTASATIVGPTLSVDGETNVDLKIDAKGTGQVILGSITRRRTSSGLTASTTQTQGQGALTSEINEVLTVASTNDTITLPTAIAGMKIVVINNGANTLQIFPASGDNLGAGVDTAITLASGLNAHYVSYDATNWETI